MCPRPWTIFSFKIIFHWIMGENCKRIFSSPATGELGILKWIPRWNLAKSMVRVNGMKNLSTPLVFAKFWIQSWLKQPKKKHCLDFFWGNSYCVPCVSAWWQLGHLRTWFSWHRAMQMPERLWSSTVTRPNGGNREFLGEIFCIFGYRKKWWAWLHDSMMIGSLKIKNVFDVCTYVYIWYSSICGCFYMWIIWKWCVNGDFSVTKKAV